MRFAFFPSALFSGEFFGVFRLLMVSKCVMMTFDFRGERVINSLKSTRTRARFIHLCTLLWEDSFGYLYISDDKR